MTFLLALSMLFTNPDTSIIGLAKTKQLQYKVPNKRYVVMIDYSKPIDTERLYLVDTYQNKIILTSKVSHAKRTGQVYATEFSNVYGSLKSSLGAYVTKTTYVGKFGYSLIISGLDKGINHKAERRKILFHSTRRMRSIYSAGCFATSEKINRMLIDLIKGGSLVYVYK